MAFRILSLDGGGIRGVLSAVILAEVERQIGKPLNQYFDLIAGTSTGSILAAAIATGRKSQDILQLYKQKGRTIFPYSSLFSLERLKLMVKYGLSAPKYSDEGLIGTLKQEFGSIELSDIGTSPRLLITAYDTLERKFIVFKSWRKFEPWSNIPLWEACTCSSSAPTFFPAHKLECKLEKGTKIYSAIDGGVGANNPTSCAVAEALRLENPLKEISVISIGTGNSNRPIPFVEASSWGVGQWMWKGRLIEVLFDASSDVNDYITEQVMSPPELDEEDDSRYLRLQPNITSDKMDDADRENVAGLIQVAENFVLEKKDKLARFLQRTKD